MANLQYSQDSWLGEVPAHWATVPAKALFSNRVERNHSDDVHLTPSQKYGVIPQAEYMEITGSRVVLNLSGADNMRHVEPGDYISHLRSFQGGLEYSAFKGKVSSAYTVLSPKRAIDPRYYKYLFKSNRYVQGLSTTTEQLRDGQSIRYEQFALLPLPFPPFKEQKEIAEFLERELGNIDALITKQLALIDTLKTRIKSTIANAVLKGLSPSAEMIHTSVGWVGEIPQHWDLVRTRYLVDISTGSGDTADAADDGPFPFYVRSEMPLTSSTWEFDGDAVLTAGDGAGVGKVFHLVSGRFMAHQRVYVMNRFRRVQPKYFYYFFSALFASVALDGSAKSTVDSLRRPTIANMYCTVPPFAEQLEIISYLDRKVMESGKLVAKTEQVVSMLRERRAAIISAAVTGKIDVQGKI